MFRPKSNKLPTNEEIGKRIREFGLSRYRTLSDFAKAMGIAQVHLSAYVRGRYRAGGKFQERLRALGANIDWIMTGEIPTISQRIQGVSLYPTYQVLEVPPPRNEALPPASSFQELKTLELPPATHVLVRVSEEMASRVPFAVAAGDMLLLNLFDKPNEGELTAARWGKRFAVGYYQSDNGKQLLRFQIPTFPVIVLPEDAALFRVVLTMKP